MATYRLSVSFVSRANGASAVAGAAYRSGQKITDERTGQTHDYTRRSGVIESYVMSPKNAPEWAQNRETLWNAAEQRENRINSQTAREFTLSLPKELTAEERSELVRGWVAENLTDRGIAADVAIHDGKGTNPHAHVLSTTRTINENGWGEKIREYQTELTQTYRPSWEQSVNRTLERAGREERVDHRSKIEQYTDAVRKDPLNIPQHLQAAPEPKRGKGVERLMAKGEVNHGMVRAYFTRKEKSDERWQELTATVREQVSLERQGKWISETKRVAHDPQRLSEVTQKMSAAVQRYSNDHSNMQQRVAAKTVEQLTAKENTVEDQLVRLRDNRDKLQNPKGMSAFLKATHITTGHEEALKNTKEKLAYGNEILAQTRSEITAINEWRDGTPKREDQIPTLVANLKNEPKTEIEAGYEWRRDILNVAQSIQREHQQQQERQRSPARTQEHDHERDRSRDRGMGMGR